MRHTSFQRVLSLSICTFTSLLALYLTKKGIEFRHDKLAILISCTAILAGYLTSLRSQTRKNQFPIDLPIVATTVIIATIFYTFLVTNGQGNILQPELFNISYDSLGKCLLRGNASVERAAIQWEQFLVDGKSYMYFGPLPALLRIPLNFLFPQFYGMWPRISVIFAGLLSCWGFGLLTHYSLGRNEYLEVKQKQSIFHLALLGFAFGTPLFFFSTVAYIYHEAAIWGLCGSIWALNFLFRIFDNQNELSKNLIGFSIGAGVALLGRVTYAIPLYSILALLGCNYIWKKIREHKVRDLWVLIACVTPGIFCFVLQLWYNHARFGSIFTFTDFRYYHSWIDSRHIPLNKIGGFFNLHRFFVGLNHYFGLPGRYLQANAPYFRLFTINTPYPDLYPIGFPNGGSNMRVIPLTLGSGWLVFSAAIGAIYLLTEMELSIVQGCLLLLLIQPALLCCYYFISQRYSADFLPCLTFLFAIFLRQATHAKNFVRTTYISTVFPVLVAASILVTVTSALSSQLERNWPSTAAYRAEMQESFDAIDRFMAGVSRTESGG